VIGKRLSSNRMPQLGELELLLMEALWLAPDSDARTLLEHLPAANRPGLATVQTTLERLHRKELVSRERRRRSFFYSARIARAELMARLIGGVIRELHTGSLDPILSSFVDFADRISPGSLQRLEQLVQQRKQTRKEGSDV
jgi:predicted transcriptional regulator